LVKLTRSVDRQTLPLRGTIGRPFSYRLPPSAQHTLHEIDMQLGGVVESSFPQIDSAADRTRYVITSLTEEAIASSQIEGAVVTRADAKRMLREKREPRTEAEWMVLNNYKAIRMLNEQRVRPLDVPWLLEIQDTLTEHAIGKPEARGRFRLPEEEVTVWDDEDQQPLHIPPPATELPQRMQALCDFANAPPAAGSQFIHPAIRAIVLHFWISYDHPFWDGNGRTARALFYWSMLRSGYWLVEYLTISSIIRGQPKTYARAFLDSETDDNDLTYFIQYHLDVIARSIREFRAYLNRKADERKRLVRVLLPARFNTRQQDLLSKALRDPDTVFTYAGHATKHGVSLMTARADLLDLEAAGLLRGNRVGRRYEFVAPPDLENRLRALADAS
jgi:Fic family protein